MVVRWAGLLGSYAWCLSALGLIIHGVMEEMSKLILIPGKRL